MALSNVDAVRTAYEALGSGDPGPLIELMHPDVEWIEPDGAPGVGTMDAGSGAYRGRDDVLTRMFGRLPTIWDNFGVQPERFLDAGEHVVVLGTLRANVPATGEPAEAPVRPRLQDRVEQAGVVALLRGHRHVAQGTGGRFLVS
jgi:uncharacterized protein